MKKKSLVEKVWAAVWIAKAGKPPPCGVRVKGAVPKLKPWAERRLKIGDQEGIKGWQKTLSKDEKDAIRNWSDTDYWYVRAIDKGETPRSMRISKVHDTLKSIITNAPKVKGTVYRGLTNLSLGDLKRVTMVGNEFKLKAVASFTEDFNVAAQYAKHAKASNGIILRVKTKSAVDIRGLTKIKSEKELLIDKGHRYKITKVEDMVAWLKEIE